MARNPLTQNILSRPQSLLIRLLEPLLQFQLLRGRLVAESSMMLPHGMNFPMAALVITKALLLVTKDYGGTLQSRYGAL